MKKLIATSAVLAFMMLMPLMAFAESDSSHINKVRKEIGRQLIEVQANNWPNVLHYYTDDIEYHDPIVTVNGISAMTEFLSIDRCDA